MEILYSLLNLVFAFGFYIITKKKGYSPDIKERLVLYNSKEKGFLWFHCASVGELNLAKPLIEHFSKNYKILITVFSPRGKDYAKKLYPFAVIKPLPFDFSFSVKRFLKNFQPEALIIVEGELWYNLIKEASKQIPVISVNTRISPKSFKLYRRLSFLYKKTLNRFALFLVRSEKDLYFLKHLIKDEKKAVLCGDLKVVSSGEVKEIFLDKKGKKVIVAGSTHSPEEEILLDVFKNIKKDFPESVLIIAPRHLERIEDIENSVKRHGFSYSFRTKTDKLYTDVYIVDTIGELSGIYRYADVVFIGGTFAPVGGHNILEPVFFKKPVVIGPNYQKIEDMYDFLKKRNAVSSVNSKEELERFIKKVLNGQVYVDINLEKEKEKVLSCYVNHIKEKLERR